MVVLHTLKADARIKQEGEADRCFFIATKYRIHVLIEDGNAAFRTLVDTYRVDADIIDVRLLLLRQVASTGDFSKSGFSLTKFRGLGTLEPGHLLRALQQLPERIHRRSRIIVRASVRDGGVGFRNMIPLLNQKGSGI